MIYVYAIVDDPAADVAGLAGLAGAPLVRFTRGRVAAVGSVHDDLELEADAGTLWQHERVTAALMAGCTVAPVRWGTVLADGGKLQEMLAAQEGRLAAVLDRLRGKVELAVRGSGGPVGSRPVQGAGAAGSGRAYLRALGDEPRHRPEAGLAGPLADIHATLAASAAAATVRAGSDGTMVAAYLVDAPRVAAFRRTVIGAGRQHHHIRLSLTGPWAPFSFVDEVMACA